MQLRFSEKYHKIGNSFKIPATDPKILVELMFLSEYGYIELTIHEQSVDALKEFESSEIEAYITQGRKKMNEDLLQMKMKGCIKEEDLPPNISPEPEDIRLAIMLGKKNLEAM